MALKHVRIQPTKDQDPPTCVGQVLEVKFSSMFSPAGIPPSLRDMATINEWPSKKAIDILDPENGISTANIGSVCIQGKKSNHWLEDPRPDPNS